MRHAGFVAAIALVPAVILTAHNTDAPAPYGAEESVLADAQALKLAGREAEQSGQLHRAKELYVQSSARYADAYNVDHPLVESVVKAEEIVWSKLRDEATVLQSVPGQAD